MGDNLFQSSLMTRTVPWVNFVPHSIWKEKEIKDSRGRSRPDDSIGKEVGIEDKARWRRRDAALYERQFIHDNLPWSPLATRGKTGTWMIHLNMSPPIKVIHVDKRVKNTLVANMACKAQVRCATLSSNENMAYSAQNQPATEISLTDFCTQAKFRLSDLSPKVSSVETRLPADRSSGNRYAANITNLHNLRKGGRIIYEIQCDLRLSGPPSGQGAGGGARTRNRKVPADLRADSLATVPPTPLWKAEWKTSNAIALLLRVYRSHCHRSRLYLNWDSNSQSFDYDKVRDVGGTVVANPLCRKFSIRDSNLTTSVLACRRYLKA
ncbi:hypothetical protein PoB_000113800 [Plakobranchus ocellatus]|uniref:Uncharacterized protein n=1 Tax=Plakobranchus ocellatus TaxID=259542 RepID=A0AAV3XXA9_9GAST|nr:hypothetical protein PoB_000113800 [Plakobranchus ocellatus]